MNQTERRFVQNLELREEEGKPPLIRGYAAVFDNLSLPLGGMFGGGFREKIAKGAFAKSLTGDIRALVGHDPDKIIGRSPKTLTLREDEHGLNVEINPPNTTVGRDVVESIRRGDLDGMSFGFTVPKGGDVWNDDDTIREVREANLTEVSVVTFPAYPQTQVAVRSLLWPEGLPEEIERREAKTKMVDGMNLHASDFAHVGDPQDPATWKLPIHDAAHARNALARFNQVQGLSASEREAAWRKIMAACKKFGIDVSKQQDSLPPDENEELRGEVEDLRAALEDRNRRCEEQAAVIINLRAEAVANTERMQRAKDQLSHSRQLLDTAQMALAAAAAREAETMKASATVVTLLKRIHVPQQEIADLRAQVDATVEAFRNLQQARAAMGVAASGSEQLQETITAAMEILTAQKPIEIDEARSQVRVAITELASEITDLSHRLILANLQK